MNLIAKLMSKENIPDSDARKLHTLIPVPAHCTVAFQRAEYGAQMSFLSGDDMLPSSIIPLHSYGNVYILGDGKTISTFTPDAYPETFTGPVEGELAETNPPSFSIQSAGNITINSPGLTTARATSVVLDLTEGEDYKYLMDSFAYLAPNGIYPMADVWNTEIAKTIVLGKPCLTVGLPAEHRDLDESTIERYFNRAKDVTLNFTQLLKLVVTKLEQGVYRISFVPAEQVLNLRMTQTNKQDLIDNRVEGLMINTVQRAVKLINHGAHTVLVSPQLRISEETHQYVKKFFNALFDYSVKFHYQGDVVLALSFDKIVKS